MYSEVLLYTDAWLGLFFFFSSRRRHTRLQGDWSSDVCSSDLTSGLLWSRSPPSDRRVSPLARLGARDTGTWPLASVRLGRRGPDLRRLVPLDRESVVEGKRGDLGGRRII